MKLKDLIESSNTGLDAIKRAPIVDYNTGIKCLRIGDISNNRSFNEWGYTEVEDINYAKFKLQKGDIIIARTGATIGINKFIDKDYKSVYNNGLIRIRVKQENNPKYVYYLLQSNNYKNFIKTISMGTSTQPNMQMNDLLNLEIPRFNRYKQDKIVKILGNIDNKIELNNEINNNLQELAKSIYYEKFKDKSNNGKLKDILDLYRKNVKNKDLSLKYFPVDVLPMNYLITKKGKPNEEAQSSLVEFKKYDILVGAMRVYFHRVCLAAEDGITRTTTFVLRPKNNDYLYYSLITLDKDDFIKYANDGSKGSTMPYAVWDNNCNEYEIYIPSTTEAKEFNELVKPLFEIQIINEKNNRDLEQLRSILLPKLINGEIDLDKIEV